VTFIDPRDDVALIPGYHSPQVDVAVRLNTNEAPEPPPPGFTEQLAAELKAVNWHRYPDRAAVELRTAIGELHGVAPERVFAANGSNEVLQLLCLAYGGAGRSVAVFEPTYALHSHIARITATGVVSGGRRDDFSLDVDDARRVLRESAPAITFLCSPNNPTGRVEDQATVEEIVAAAPGLVVVDEAYGQFSPWSALALAGDDVPLVVVRTFSKTWSMAAARLGYCVAPARVIDDLERVCLPYHLDALKQLAGRLALQFEPEMQERVAFLVGERERVHTALGSLAVDTWPSGANFLLFRPRASDGRTVWEALLERSVLVRDCSGWPGLAGCLRVTLGTRAENDAFLAALAEAIGTSPA
jgi:histidinol-phosphate aminotransferase